MRELGRVSQRSRDLGWKEARENYREVLFQLYSEYPVPRKLEEELEAAEAFVGGDEHLITRLASDSKRIYKLTAHDQFGVTYFFDKNDVTLEGTATFWRPEMMTPIFIFCDGCYSMKSALTKPSSKALCHPNETAFPLAFV